MEFGMLAIGMEENAATTDEPAQRTMFLFFKEVTLWDMRSHGHTCQ